MLKPCFPSLLADAADFIAGDIGKLRLLIIANYL